MTDEFNQDVNERAMIKLTRMRQLKNDRETNLQQRKPPSFSAQTNKSDDE